MEEFCFLPSLPPSTGKAWESVLPTWTTGDSFGTESQHVGKAARWKDVCRALCWQRGVLRALAS